MTPEKCQYFPINNTFKNLSALISISISLNLCVPIDNKKMNIVYGKSSFAYSKMEMEDPEEMKSRKAQFLIYKSLQKADDSIRKSRKQSWLKVRIFKLKIKFGRKMKKLKKSLMVVSRCGAERIGVFQQWKNMFTVRRTTLKIPTVFASIQ
ncbi:hypothetical protein QVD17_00144 [Tagetes erecta]|uniref:Uncharacterized protein n=1 Tax=Tagetes erecta TaxID=13708 RepID=A0AAD8P6Q7_TARER|nr:hypothetical protein QVD17_00144 [Tagetes erecta]